MIRVFLLFFLLLLSTVSSFKFLCYSPLFGSSHYNFLATLADSLIEEGHEVVILTPILDSKIKRKGATGARVIEFQTDVGREYEANINAGMIDATWSSGETWQALQSWSAMYDVWVAQCNSTLNYPGLLDQLRAEKFDVGYGESMDWCMAGLFHLVGIEKFAITESISLKDGHSAVTQVADAPSYVPSIMGGSFGDDMTIFQRAFNLFNRYMYQRFNYRAIPNYQPVLESYFPGFPNIEDLMASNSLFFLNSDPLVDFPRPSAARIVDIGGIVVSNGHKKLDEKWSTIFDLRSKTVLMSFGTFAKAYVMPEEYKETIRETARALPDVTFIWKYEETVHNVTQGIPNLIETTWAPQHDMLHDPRLSAFVTHCGQGSMTEANYAGVPLVAVPVIFDQVRNAFQVKRNGLGVNIDKTDLGKKKVFENAIREVIENPKYKTKAVKIASMLNDKPFTARQIFVRNMEFLAKHGPLRQLDHYGRHLNIFQYYLIDVIAVFSMSCTTVVSFVIYVAVRIFQLTTRKVIKRKTE